VDQYIFSAHINVGVCNTKPSELQMWKCFYITAVTVLSFLPRHILTLPSSLPVTSVHVV